MPSTNRVSSTPLQAPHAPLTPAAPGTNPQAAGRSFEAMFASMLVKQMRQGLDGKTMFGNDKSDSLGGLFDHFIGQHMASGSGFGIASMIRRQLESRSTTHVQPPPQRPLNAYNAAALPLHRAPAARNISPGVGAATLARPGSGVSAT